MLVIFQKGNKVINKAFAALVTTIKLTNETVARLEKCVFILRANNKNWKDFRVTTTAFQDKISTFRESSSNERIVDSVVSAMSLPRYN